MEKVEKKSFQGNKRRYHRFRYSSHDSSAVADCVGSNLRCAHEWGWCEGILSKPTKGRLYSPSEVEEKLVEMCEEEGVKTVRFTGMEPVMGDSHLIQAIERLESYKVRIDTNGMLLTPELASKLAKFDNLSIRLSFKGSNPENFSKLTGVEPKHFKNQLRAFKACKKYGIETNPVLAGVYGREEVMELQRSLEGLGKGNIGELCVEDLHICRENKEKLEKAGFVVERFIG
ncbi:MAG: radical SAM protein [Candidatus Nanohaloarchaeota archaeon QJJ-9]|nr:radical SAM protein [Candidatus Nanohaloarchaeota archaeon QJJ-9]